MSERSTVIAMCGGMMIYGIRAEDWSCGGFYQSYLLGIFISDGLNLVLFLSPTQPFTLSISLLHKLPPSNISLSIYKYLLLFIGRSKGVLIVEYFCSNKSFLIADNFV